MADKNFDKKLELREWQKLFNPSKPSERASVLLKNSGKGSEKPNNNTSNYFSG
ncbi:MULTISPECIES: hypothetical protein [Enterobacteriaceae]|uniref:hypothetical protein n=1 Tax=Enterobacteriaceae TaxID=543 RepID=UPI0002DBD053|nr:hypothetical protein [Enterobacter sp. Ag1]